MVYLAMIMLSDSSAFYSAFYSQVKVYSDPDISTDGNASI